MLPKRQEQTVDQIGANIGKVKNVDFRLYDQGSLTYKQNKLE